jgi:NADPH-dependent 2,4-dienoyl-CoA reductase/sulfur reductase-like enzyme/nitrite reductase/ring-hydroxylating ferredoxin subunit
MNEEDEFGPDLSAGIKMTDLPDGALLGGSLDGQSVVLVNNGGRICAFAGKCTHLGAPLKDGILVDGQLRCPWHHARFSLETGQAVAAPAFRALDAFRVNQRENRLFVTKAASKTGANSPTLEKLPAIVIIGGGAAGFACAELLSRSGFGASITVVSDDPDPPYDRTFCSKQYLIGLSSRDECFLKGANFPSREGAVLKISRRVTALDLGTKQVELNDGERLAFDSLVLATGAGPKKPDAPGFDRPNVYVLRTLRDADAIIAEASKGRRAAILGASFIGLEVAASLRQRDVGVDVIASDKIPLEKILGSAVGTMIRDVDKSKGVRFHLGRRPSSFDGRMLELDDGSTLEVDFIVAGLGVTPRTELAEAAGLTIASQDNGGGVVVNERLETSAANVYAVGDIAYYPDRYANRSIRVEHWVHAQRQGQHVARVLMGQATSYADLPFFWSAHFDTGLLYLGHADKPAEPSVEGSIDEQDFVARYLGKGDDRAVVTCNQDKTALQIEAAWEGSGSLMP